jgi:hypothetical protein
MDPNDLALIAEQVRDMLGRVDKLSTKEAMPELTQKLIAVRQQLASLPAALAAAPAPPAAEAADEEPAAPPPPAVPKPVALDAFAAEHSPPDADIRDVILRLLFTIAPAEEQQMMDEDGSVWKVDWSNMPESAIRPPKKPEPGERPIPKPELWDDLSEGR